MVTQSSGLSNLPQSGPSLDGESPTGVHTLQVLFHFLAGAAIAVFLIPEGAPMALAGAAVCALMKCAYDYIDIGRVPPMNAVALMAGAAVAALAAVAHTAAM